MKWQVLRPSEAHRGTGPHGQKCGRIPEAAQTPSGALISTEWPLAHSENFITNQALIFTHHWRGRIWLWGPQNKLGNKKLWCRIQSSARNILPIGPLPIKWERRGNWFLVKQKLYKLALCFPMTNYPQCRHSTPSMIGQARDHCLLHSSYKWSSSPDNFSHENYYLDIQIIPPFWTLKCRFVSNKYLCMKEGLGPSVETWKRETSDEGLQESHSSWS